MSKREQFLNDIESSKLSDFFQTLDMGERESIFNESIVEYNSDATYYPFDEDTLNELFTSPYECARAMHFGNVSWNDDYITFNGYANLESIPDLTAYMLDYIDEMRDSLIDEYGDEICEYYDVYDDDEDEDER